MHVCIYICVCTYIEGGGIHEPAADTHGHDEATGGTLCTCMTLYSCKYNILILIYICVYIWRGGVHFFEGYMSWDYTYMRICYT